MKILRRDNILRFTLKRLETLHMKLMDSKLYGRNKVKEDFSHTKDTLGSKLKSLWHKSQYIGSYWGLKKPIWQWMWISRMAYGKIWLGICLRCWLKMGFRFSRHIDSLCTILLVKDSPYVGANSNISTRDNILLILHNFTYQQI